MIIISKFKDYYDWVVSKYGRDPLIILDRRKNFTKLREYEDKTQINHHLIFIGEEQFHLYFYKGKLYYTEQELIKLHDLKVHSYWDLDYYVSMHGKKRTVYRYRHLNKLPPKDAPIICTFNNGIWHSFKLSEVDFQKVIPAEKMYLKIYDILSKQKEEKKSKPMTDKEKIISHGMDLKKSFRHRKDG